MSGVSNFTAGLVGTGIPTPGSGAGFGVPASEASKIVSQSIDISVAAYTEVLARSDSGIWLSGAYLICSGEATDASGSDSGDVTLGTTDGGAEVFAAVAYPVSQAIGDVTEITLVRNYIEVGQMLFMSHDQVAEAGIFKLVLVGVGL